MRKEFSESSYEEELMRGATDRGLENISLKRERKKESQRKARAAACGAGRKEGEDLLELDGIVQWRDLALYRTSHEFSSTFLTKSLKGVGDSTLRDVRTICSGVGVRWGNVVMPIGSVSGFCGLFKA